MSDKNVFVFVVCGENSHIQKLNNALKFLKHFSALPIIVITDSRRNKITIEHDNIIDVSTAAELNHHQASIFLKTSLHKVLDTTNNYCYLDSDVLALSPKVNDIFKQQYGQVTFAADHCTIQSFSPYALNCGCLQNKENNLKIFIEAVQKYFPDYVYNDFYHNDKARELNRMINKVKNNIYENPVALFKYLWNLYMPLKNLKFKIELNNEFRYIPHKDAWFDFHNNCLMYMLSSYYKTIQKDTGFIFNKRKQTWLNREGENIEYPKCTHLLDAIKHTFNVDVKDKNYKHWNGGVFLFNKDAANFMETWHKNTLKTFKMALWKTRDQGTLVASVWQLGLQSQKVLPKEFNFIADYYNTDITYHKELGFTNDNFNTSIKPFFIHVFHEYGNKNWDIWKAIEAYLIL